MDHGPHHPLHPSSPPRAAGLPLLSGAGGTATDPVCGMTVDPARAAASVTHDGHTYYFCAAENWVDLLLATPLVFWCGLPFFRRAGTSVVRRSPNMFTLIALGVAAAYFYSVAALLAPQALGPGLYFETAGVIIVLVLLG